MPLADFTLARRALVGAFDGLTDPGGPVAYIFRKDFDVSDAGTAATQLAESPAMQIGGNGGGPGQTNLSGKFWFTPQVAITANNTNFATINIYKRTGTGSRVLLATLATTITGSGNLSAFVPVLIPPSSIPFTINAGDVLSVEILKSGTGVAIAAATGFSNISFELGN